jgi:ketosteroid isomerase-like protein
MAQDNVDVIESAWAAFGRGDIETATSVADPSGEIVVPESLPWGGTYHGPEGFREFLANLQQHFEQFEAKPEKVLGADDDHVVVLARVKGRTKGGADYEGESVWLYKMRGGQVVRADTFTDTVRIKEALG